MGSTTGIEDDEAILRALFGEALRCAMPAGRFAGRLPPRPEGRTIVVGAGKAAASMAAAFEAAWDGPCEGLVVTRYGHRVATRQVEVVEAAHPVPDRAGQEAAERILALARAAGPADLVVALVSGGASALLTLPAPGVTLEDKQRVNRELLRSGMPIGEMNVVRRALSAIKGGRLAAAAAPARVVTYAISDVPGDEPATIGSGPTVFAERAGEDAAALLARFAIALEPRLAEAIARNAPPRAPAGEVPRFEMLATPGMALEAAADAARRLGIEPVIWGDDVEGEAREVGREHARRVLAHRPARPVVFLSGGETTVTVGSGVAGRGGRNTEYLLALAVELAGRPGFSALACDTDGIDGSEPNAGAWFDGSLHARAGEAGLDLADHLRRHDAFTLFERLDRLVATGPTFTNVNDFRAILVRPEG